MYTKLITSITLQQFQSTFHLPFIPFHYSRNEYSQTSCKISICCCNKCQHGISEGIDCQCFLFTTTLLCIDPRRLSHTSTTCLVLFRVFAEEVISALWRCMEEGDEVKSIWTRTFLYRKWMSCEREMHDAMFSTGVHCVLIIYKRNCSYEEKQQKGYVDTYFWAGVLGKIC